MNTTKVHIGRKIKELFADFDLTDYRIIKATEINQSYLCKVYTSRDLDSWQVKRLFHKVNKEFDLNLSPENLYK